MKPCKEKKKERKGKKEKTCDKKNTKKFSHFQADLKLAKGFGNLF